MINAHNILFICIGTVTIQVPSLGEATYVGEVTSDGKACGEGVATPVDDKNLKYSGMFLDNQIHGKSIAYHLLDHPMF